MRALIAAGGHATRLRPITHTTNKHLIPLAGRPMIFYAVEKIVEAGIRDIAINVNPGDRSIERAVGDGSRWGARISYLEQNGGPLGIAHVVANAREFLGDEPFVFYLGDNIILGSIKPLLAKFRQDRLNCLLALSRVNDPRRFGVPLIKNGRIVRVEEKPDAPKSDYAVTGIYVYDRSFFQAFEHMRPSARGEYEISDIHTWLVEKGFAVGWEEITGWWKDTGRPEDLLEGNRLLLKEVLAAEAVVEGAVQPGAELTGAVRVGAGTVIGRGARICGPVWIGRDCLIENAAVGPNVSIGDRVVIADGTIADSVVFDGVRLGCGRRLTGSLIGYNVLIRGAAATVGGDSKIIVGDNSVVEI